MRVERLHWVARAHQRLCARELLLAESCWLGHSLVASQHSLPIRTAFPAGLLATPPSSPQLSSPHFTHSLCSHPPLLLQVTKQNLADKIAQLNAAIDDVSSQLNSRDAVKEEAKA